MGLKGKINIGKTKLGPGSRLIFNALQMSNPTPRQKRNVIIFDLCHIEQSVICVWMLVEIEVGVG